MLSTTPEKTDPTNAPNAQPRTAAHTKSSSPPPTHNATLEQDAAAKSQAPHEPRTTHNTAASNRPTHLRYTRNGSRNKIRSLAVSD